MKLIQIVVLSTLLFLSQAFVGIAQQRTGTSTTYNKDILNRIKAVENHPDSIEAHQAFLRSNLSRDEMIKQYKLWMKKFPKSATVPFAIGKFFSTYLEPLTGQPYLVKAVELNPKLAEAWSLMSQNALNYDYTYAQQCALKATLLKPADPEYAYQYAGTFKDTDEPKYDSLMLTIANRFPGTAQGSLAYSQLIERTNDPIKKQQYYTAIFNHPPAKRAGWYNSLTGDFFYFLLETDPQQAMELAQQMSTDKKNALFLNDWRNEVQLASNIKQVNNLMTAGKADSAIIMIDSIKTNAVDLKAHLFLLKEKALYETGNIREAYNNLIADYSKEPQDTTHSLMVKYGREIGLTDDQIMADVWKLRDSSSKIATGFRLKNYLTNDSVSLSSYRGKVVLLTYWFPECPPCREEFTSFESVIKKVNNNNLAYLGLNILSYQDKEVLPLIKLKNYTFTPLNDGDKRDKGTLPSPFAPSNYLIDQYGNIIFSDFQIGKANERTLELMITELLNRKKVIEEPSLADSLKLTDTAVVK